jgi:ABC-type transport system involved in Fe-S cluster assembly fused permease/ATPase subunit
MSQLSFDHLLNLSFAWHTRRKTGEILRVLDRGAAINHTFEVRGLCITLRLRLKPDLAYFIQHHTNIHRHCSRISRILYPV